jgi:hypothetical protein
VKPLIISILHYINIFFILCFVFEIIPTKLSFTDARLQTRVQQIFLLYTPFSGMTIFAQSTRYADILCTSCVFRSVRLTAVTSIRWCYNLIMQLSLRAITNATTVQTCSTTCVCLSSLTKQPAAARQIRNTRDVKQVQCSSDDAHITFF